MSFPLGSPVASSPSFDLRYEPEARIVMLRCHADAKLGSVDGATLIEFLARWVGEDPGDFFLLADARGLRSVDAEFRRRLSDFFKSHGHNAMIGVIGAGPAIRVIAEMFRIGAGVRLVTFADEASARAWVKAGRSRS
jgi:hypothetical protein